MNRLVSLLLSIGLLVGIGCSPKKPEVTSLQRKEAANLFKEAEFAVTIRDLPRAVGLLRQATKLCPDEGDYWLNLGNLTRKAGHVIETKSAYTSALAAYTVAYKIDKTDSAPLMRQMYVHALLGETDQAKATLKKARSAHPKDPRVLKFDEKALTEMMASPGFKELGI